MTANFWYNIGNSKQEILFESGDVIVFDTGVSANIEHGITSFVKGSTPTFLKDTEWEDKRISIQFRETIHRSKMEYELVEQGTKSFQKVEQTLQKTNFVNKENQILMSVNLSSVPDPLEALSEDNFKKIPKRLLTSFFSYLDFESVLKIASCCKYFYLLSKEIDSIVWKNIAFSSHKILDQLILEENEKRAIEKKKHTYHMIFDVERLCMDKFVEENDNNLLVVPSWKKKTKVLRKHISKFKTDSYCPTVIELGECNLFYILF